MDRATAPMIPFALKSSGLFPTVQGMGAWRWHERVRNRALLAVAACLAANTAGALLAHPRLALLHEGASTLEEIDHAPKGRKRLRYSVVGARDALGRDGSAFLRRMGTAAHSPAELTVIEHTQTREQGLNQRGAPTGGDTKTGGPSSSPSGNAERQRGDWEVQAGASQDRASAEALVRQLSDRGYRAFILPAEETADSWHRIRIGGLETRAEAQALARELIAEGFAGAFVPMQ
jgi:hypothetical protein